MTELDTNPAAAVVAGSAKPRILPQPGCAGLGQPVVSADGDRIYTPHKAIRRYVDHLAEVECLLGGVATEPDRWHAILVTFDSDWSRFTEVDLDEARQRVGRLGRLYELRYQPAVRTSGIGRGTRTGRCVGSPNTSATPGTPARWGS
jgi:hypothetical protein